MQNILKSHYNYTYQIIKANTYVLLKNTPIKVDISYN